jgi:hypothetical protein
VQGQPAVVALDIDAGDAVDSGAAEAVLAADALGVGEGGGGVDVPPGHRLQAAAALDDAADVIDVVAGVQAHIVAAQGARLVGDSVGVKLQDAAAVEVPLLKRSPSSLMLTLFPAISAPEPSRSPGLTLA